MRINLPCAMMRVQEEWKMKIPLLTAVASLVFASACGALDAQQHNQVVQNAREAAWGPAPPVLPAGAQIAVLAGNPTGSVPYTIRLKFPAHYAIPAHSHPTDEHVVVVSGALTFGMGDKLVKNAATNKTLAAGGFALMPAEMNHYAFAADEETTIILYGQGPVEFKYVNSADDPRNKR
jgi:quercetin dioxygenase-like cupin family protein